MLLQKKPLGLARGHRLQGQRAECAGRTAENPVRLVLGETGKLCGLQIGGDRIGLLDAIMHRAGQSGRQLVAQVNGRGQTLLNRPIPIPQEALEGGDHVADDIFRRIVKQRRQAQIRRRLIVLEHIDQIDHQKAVLRNRKGVVAERLTIPTGHACKAMGDIFHLDIERGRIGKVEPATGQHALPDPHGLPVAFLCGPLAPPMHGG